MKKKLLFMFVLLFTFLNTKIYAAEADSYIDWELDRSVFVRQTKDGQVKWMNLAMMTANGKVAYCIEPGVTAGKGQMYSSTINMTQVGIPIENIKYMELVGYYGYGNFGNNEKEYYMAAQELIWRRQGVQDVLWTDAKEGGNVIDISFYKNKILEKVNKHHIKPEFNLKESYLMGSTVILEDKNNILPEYKRISGNATLNGNKLSFRVSGDGSFTLERIDKFSQTVIYYKDGFQKVGSFGVSNSVVKTYSYKHHFGSITVKKIPEDGNKLIYGTLKGAEYTIYDQNKKALKTLATDDKGVVIFTGLPKGKYTIKEIKPSDGYLLNKEEIKVTIDEEHENVNVKHYEPIIKNIIKLNKRLDDEEGTPEKDILFGIYDVNNILVKEVLTDENGDATFELPYGTYIVKQLTVPDGVEKVDDFEIVVLEDGLTKEYKLVNHVIEKEIEPPLEIDELPNTGRSFNYILIFSIIFTIAVIFYDKENA